MRQMLTRSGGLAGAVLLASITGGEEPAHAQAIDPAATPRPDVRSAVTRPTGRIGRPLRLRGTVTPAARGRRVSLQVAREGRWKTIARTRTRADGSYKLRLRPRQAFSARARIATRATDGRRMTRRIGRLEIYRSAAASWYGPGLYGNTTACGQELTPELVGVAHKTLPCGTAVEISYRGVSMIVPVVDRGPFVRGMTWDLTEAAARALGFTQTARVGALVQAE